MMSHKICCSGYRGCALNRSRPGEVLIREWRGKGTTDINVVTMQYQRTHQAALSPSLADGGAVTTLDIELASDTLNSIAPDGHRSVKIDRCSMWTAFWNFCLISRFRAAHCGVRRILLTGLDCTVLPNIGELLEGVACHVVIGKTRSNFSSPHSSPPLARVCRSLAVQLA